MRNKNVVQNLADKKVGTGKRAKIIIAIIALIFICMGAFGGYRYSNATTFPKGVKIDGVDVSGLKTEDAVKKITDANNSFTIEEEGQEPKKINTSFTYDIKSSVRAKIGISSVDPRVLIGKGVSYNISLKNAGGIKESAKTIGDAVPDAQGVKYTEDAYIDYNNMKIVPEVQGDSVDFTKVAKDIAEKKASDYKFNKYKIDRKKLISEPKVTAESLKDEFEFAKKYISKPLYLNTVTGTPYEVDQNSLAKVILYTKEGPKYSKKGAKEVAKGIAEKYSGNTLTVKTLAGDKTLYNSALKLSVDVDKTADSILDSAKNGKTGTIVTDRAASSGDGSHLEINLAAQNVKYIKNGNVVFTSSIVSGGPGHRTRTGIFKINGKMRNVTLKGRNDDGSDYESPVSYWMPFDGGNGLHDATWRGAFGGGIYVSNGSHGCVNMPPSMAAQLFGIIPAGTIVYVYN